MCARVYGDNIQNIRSQEIINYSRLYIHIFPTLMQENEKCILVSPWVREVVFIGERRGGGARILPIVLIT